MVAQTLECTRKPFAPTWQLLLGCWAAKKPPCAAACCCDLVARVGFQGTPGQGPPKLRHCRHARRRRAAPACAPLAQSDLLAHAARRPCTPAHLPLCGPAAVFAARAAQAAVVRLCARVRVCVALRRTDLRISNVMRLIKCD